MSHSAATAQDNYGVVSLDWRLRDADPTWLRQDAQATLAGEACVRVQLRASDSLKLSNMLAINEPRLSELKRQYQRLPVPEQRRWRAVLRDAQRLDEQLADLHLAFPAIEVRFYGREMVDPASFSPAELLQAIASWHAHDRSQGKPRPR